jgi:hypothetical protein
VISNGVIDLIPTRTPSLRSCSACSRPEDGSRSRTSRSRTQSAPRGGATSTSGLAELPGRCWKQRTPSSWNATVSSGLRPASSWTPTPAPSSRTRGARRRSSAPAERHSRPTGRARSSDTGGSLPSGASASASSRLSFTPCSHASSKTASVSCSRMTVTVFSFLPPAHQGVSAPTCSVTASDPARSGGHLPRVAPCRAFSSSHLRCLALF